MLAGMWRIGNLLIASKVLEISSHDSLERRRITPLDIDAHIDTSKTVIPLPSLVCLHIPIHFHMNSSFQLPLNSPVLSVVETT